MKTLRVEGHSDDTLVVYGDVPRGTHTHDDCANLLLRAFLVDAGNDGRVLITGVYGKVRHGTWALGLALYDEADSWPAWAQPRWRADGYSPIMELTVPDHAVVTLDTVDGKPRDERKSP